MRDSNCYIKLNFPRHLILNMLRIRHYKKLLLYVFIYLGFTVYISGKKLKNKKTFFIQTIMLFLYFKQIPVLENSLKLFFFPSHFLFLGFSTPIVVVLCDRFLKGGLRTIHNSTI